MTHPMTVPAQVSHLQQLLQKEYEEKRVLQAQKERLMRRKETLERYIEDSTTLDNDEDSCVQEIHNKVFPLVKEIHNLDLRKQDLESQLRWLEIQEEVRSVFIRLAAVTKAESSGLLCPWYKQLQSIFGASARRDVRTCQLCHEPKYEPSFKSGEVQEKLSFGLCHHGVSVNLCVKLAADPQTASPSSSSGEELSSLRNMVVTSDIHIDRLTEKTRYLLSDKRPVMDLLDFITDFLDCEIIPHVST